MYNYILEIRRTMAPIVLLKIHNIFYRAAAVHITSAAPEGRIFSTYTEKQWNFQKIQHHRCSNCYVYTRVLLTAAIHY